MTQRHKHFYLSALSFGGSVLSGFAVNLLTGGTPVLGWAFLLASVVLMGGHIWLSFWHPSLDEEKAMEWDRHSHRLLQADHERRTLSEREAKEISERIERETRDGATPQQVQMWIDLRKQL